MTQLLSLQIMHCEMEGGHVRILNVCCKEEVWKLGRIRSCDIYFNPVENTFVYNLQLLEVLHISFSNDPLRYLYIEVS